MMGMQRRRAGVLALGAALFCAMSGQALAHASDRGHVLLLPTGHYIVGGALTVLASFLILAICRPEWLDALARKRWLIGALPGRGRVLVSSLSFLFCLMLVLAGFWGSRDPLANPLPLFVWSMMWIGLVIAHGIFGNIWAWLNPWYGPWRMASAALGLAGRQPLLRWRAGLASWPAVASLAGFAWFELVYPAPDDSARLAMVVALYWLAIFAATLLFGYRRTVTRIEFLSLFMAMISRLSVFDATRGRLSLRFPTAGIIGVGRLPLSGVAFILLALSSVTFDGMRYTFFWLQKIGINPLEFPGRSAVMAQTSAGLALAFALLAAAFIGSVVLGHKIAGRGEGALPAASMLVWTIMPISFAYHVAHYLPAFAISSQYAFAALSDPFATGLDLFGTADYQVRAGIIAGAENAWIVWNIQAGVIVLGHVLAVIAAHVIAWRIYGSGRAATLSQLPLAALMIGYTVLGLWLLSAPTAM
jgi:hypothetical protein